MAAICPAEGLREFWVGIIDVIYPNNIHLSFFDSPVSPDINTVFTDLSLISTWDEGEFQDCAFSVEAGPDGGGHITRTVPAPLVFTNNTGGDLVAYGWVLWLHAGVNSSILFVEELATPITVPNTLTLSWTPTIEDKSEF